jgi:hypothetical protein
MRSQYIIKVIDGVFFDSEPDFYDVAVMHQSGFGPFPTVNPNIYRIAHVFQKYF